MFLAEDYEQIVNYNGDIVGFYYDDLKTGPSYDVNRTSEKMNEYFWTGGWRIEDAGRTIMDGGCPDDCVFQDVSMYFVLEASSMTITLFGPLVTSEQTVEEVKRIDSLK